MKADVTSSVLSSSCFDWFYFLFLCEATKLRVRNNPSDRFHPLHWLLVAGCLLVSSFLKSTVTFYRILHSARACCRFSCSAPHALPHTCARTGARPYRGHLLTAAQIISKPFFKFCLRWTKINTVTVLEDYRQRYFCQIIIYVFMKRSLQKCN